MGYVPYNTVSRLAARALSSGGEHKSLRTITWDVSSGCINPHHTAIVGGRSVQHKLKKADPYGHMPTLVVEVTAKCRRCPICLRRRGHEWTERAKREIGLSHAGGHRVWWCTLTFDFSNYLNALGGLQNDPLVWKRARGSASREVTLWLKRLRQPWKEKGWSYGSRFRYLIVMEPMPSGAPHFHALLHETSFHHPIREARIRAAWARNGFAHGVLVKHSAKSGEMTARYLAKYLSKEMRARVRASKFYGLPVTRLS